MPPTYARGRPRRDSAKDGLKEQCSPATFTPTDSPDLLVRQAALLIPVRRLNAATWLEATPLTAIHLLTPRPSLPPGRVALDLESQGKQPSGGTQLARFPAWPQWARHRKLASAGAATSGRRNPNASKMRAMPSGHRARRHTMSWRSHFRCTALQARAPQFRRRSGDHLFSAATTGALL
jgi:hypothetical protein